MEAKLLSNKDIDSAAWDELIDNSLQGTVFMKSWYISTLDSNWKGIMVYEDTNLVAVMPLLIKRKLLITYSLQPILAKYWGLAIVQREFNNIYKEYNWKKNIIQEVISTIPKGIKVFSNNFHPSFDYALPFSWEGYKLKTRYTFKIDLTESYEKIEANFLYKVRSAIKKAEKEGITIVENKNVDELIDIFKLYKHSGNEIIPEKEHDSFRKLFSVSNVNNSAFSLSAKLNGGKTIASSFFIYDTKAVYCIASILDPAYKEYHAIQCLIPEAIKRSQVLAAEFDFLGVSLKSLEFFFRRFGPKPVPYIQITRNKLPFKII